MRAHQHRGHIQHKATTYGQSVQGAALEVYLPSKQAELLIFAGIHGEEPETTVLLSKALRCLDVPLTHCAVVLAANPDGLVRGTRANANGVDLNRNFPAQNWQEADVCHRWEHGRPQEVALSSGSQAASEPETQALIKLIADLQPNHIISMHGPLGCIDDPLASPLGQWMAQQTDLPLVPDIGDPTPGSFGSWCADEGLPVITYELPAESVWAMQAKHLSVLHALLLGKCASISQ